MTRLSAPLERDIQRTIMDYLRMAGWLVIRLNSGALLTTSQAGVRSFARFNDPGSRDWSLPDLLAIDRDGTVLWVEVKRPGGKPTARQQRFLDEVRGRGQHVVVATCLEDVLAAILQIMPTQVAGGGNRE